MTAALTATPLYRFYRSGEDETAALRGVALTVEAGETVAVIGPSGSGKSTLLACLAGTDEPDGGTVTVAGTRLSHRAETERAATRARSIGLMFQSSNLFAHLTVAGNLTLARRLARTRGSARTHQRTEGELLSTLGIGHRARAYPAELSGGELARAALAIALANEPDVVLADEPTGELDAATEQQVLDLLRECARSGVAVLIASHSPAVLAAADRIITLSDGIVDSGAGERVVAP